MCDVSDGLSRDLRRLLEPEKLLRKYVGRDVTLNAAVYRIERSNVVQGTGEDVGNASLVEATAPQWVDVGQPLPRPYREFLGSFDGAEPPRVIRWSSTRRCPCSTRRWSAGRVSSPA